MVIANAIKIVGLSRQSDSDVIDQANGYLARAITWLSIRVAATKVSSEIASKMKQ